MVISPLAVGFEPHPPIQYQASESQQRKLSEAPHDQYDHKHPRPLNVNLP
jgi:hypothetical protein